MLWERGFIKLLIYFYIFFILFKLVIFGQDASSLSMCALLHCLIAHYKPLARKTIIHLLFGNVGALEMFWELVLN